MARWLENKQETVYVIAEDGNRYPFQSRKTHPDSGYISVKGPDGRRFSVAGDREGNRFVTNPFGKNARALLTQEEIDKAKGLERLHDPMANELGPKPFMKMTEEEVAAYLDERYSNGNVE